MDADEEREMLKDLIWLNAVIATELIQVTENVSSLLRQGPPPDSCLADHNRLRLQALAIVEKYRDATTLRDHLLGHR
ncbi:MAG: hypothetical protein GKC05_00365 [Methanomicrobiales archaeon]|nr:hypothetical protein [Methanomicrobiales archaeon]NYT20176.1 hypothetical protein [Methanomicrobiales archaeon]